MSRSGGVASRRRPASARLALDVTAAAVGGAALLAVVLLEVRSPWLGLAAMWATCTLLSVGAWDGGSTRAWRKLRAEVLRANRRTHGGRCRLGLACCTGTAAVVHHVLGRSVSGDDPRYLLAACAACNLKLGDPSRHNKDPKSRGKTRW